MFLVLWEFEVKPGCEERFERVYGPGADWDFLFRRDARHDREVVPDTTRSRVYLTADSWKSRNAYEEFLFIHEDPYRALDWSANELTANERNVGSYETLAP